MDVIWFIIGTMIGYFVPKYAIAALSNPHKQGHNPQPSHVVTRPDAPTAFPKYVMKFKDNPVTIDDAYAAYIKE